MAIWTIRSDNDASSGSQLPVGPIIGCVLTALLLLGLRLYYSKRWRRSLGRLYGDARPCHEELQQQQSPSSIQPPPVKIRTSSTLAGAWSRVRQANSIFDAAYRRSSLHLSSTLRAARINDAKIPSVQEDGTPEPNEEYKEQVENLLTLSLKSKRKVSFQVPGCAEPDTPEPESAVSDSADPEQQLTGDK
ncbi:hypothetical protein RI367_004958 [Sorochytrium milnesiophthora]